MTRYVLVEDERFAYEEMKRMMQMLRPDYQLVGWAESIEQAVLLLRQNKIDLMIVDIRLSDGLSFEIFEQCPIDIPVLFTTAYDEYALQAFKVNSIDYLLKPIEENELDAALHKFERNHSLHSTTPQYKKLETDYLAGNKKNRFLVQIGDTFQYAETHEVAFSTVKKSTPTCICSPIKGTLSITIGSTGTNAGQGSLFPRIEKLHLQYKGHSKEFQVFRQPFKVIFPPGMPA